MANEPKPQYHPEKTGVYDGPNPRPAGEGVPLTTEVPSTGETCTPGPGRITEEDAQKDQAARTGRGGLGTTG
jgi:hypothetical protein